MLFVLLVAVVFADYCSVDNSLDGVDYTLNDIYNQKYCGDVCPCTGDDCTMDFSNSNQREIGNVTGSIGTLITRYYELTYALYIEDSFVVNKVIVNSIRTQYKLDEAAKLSVVSTEKNENATDSSFTTIFRCNKECTVFDSNFVKEKDNSYSFIAERNDDDEDIPSTLTLQNVHFTIGYVSDENAYIYARENVALKLQDVQFTIDGSDDEKTKYASTPIPLIYNAKGFEESVVTVDGDYTVESKCDGKWIVAVPTGAKEFECFDPTITTGSEGLEQGCNIAFIIMYSFSLATLAVILTVFAVLLLIPFVKSKLGKGRVDYDSL
ncbi:Uncharacterized protein QTN25_008481 [Entamoeba marina]